MNKRFNIDWDNELTQEQLINLILTDEDLPKLRSLTIGNWGDCWENETCQPIIDMIVENAPRFTHLESLFIGDMESEDCEISWIKQGDYSRLYAALPNLKELIIKGASDLHIMRNWSTWKSFPAASLLTYLPNYKMRSSLH